MKMDPRLKTLRRDISRAIGGSRGPFWNNVVMLTLQCIDKEFGTPAANKAIRDFELNKLGWLERG